MIRFRSAALSKSGRNVEFTAFFFFIAKEKGGKQVYKILIVDDEAIERRCISFILENSKYSLEIEEAENGQKAYERLQEKEFDILFSDVKMPFMDGLELAEKAVHLYSDIRVIIFSGFSEFEYARTAIRIGCVNYILKPVNPEAMSPINGTEALLGSFNWVYGEYNALTHTEDRYVSFYANGSYTFDERYSLTGSIRIDQSNLFGTDPKYQYRPLWSVGGSWQIANEPFMEDCMWLNRLNLRMTYGVGGNVPKDAGPYMTVVDSGYNEWVGDFGSYIQNPPNSQLRWEKTASTNVGIDFSAFNSRLSGSIDYYYKKTTDLLGNRNADPTLGWASLLQNYGSMFNRGVELSLQSVNIQNKNFTWGTNLMFSYNKNELTNLEGTKETVFYYSAYNVAAVGYPINSVFSYRYAGLDPTNGNVLVYNKEGEKVSKVSSIDDMVYSGTRTPKYTASLKNFFSYRDFDFSFMFVYYGGHVLRDVVAGYMGGAPSANLTRKALNHWRKPGDENIPGVAPSFNRNIYYTDAQAWYSADIHVKKADYIKLRDISLSYNLPKNWLRKYFIESAAVTCQISNVWWWAANGDIDPEAYTTSGYGWGALTLPNPTTYTIGLSLNF